jgi:hypothetical protein
MAPILVALLLGIPPRDTTPPRRDSSLAVAVDTQGLEARVAQLEHSYAKLDSLFSGPTDTARTLRYRPISEYPRAGSVRLRRTVRHPHHSRR